MRRKIGRRRNTIVTGSQNKVDAIIHRLRCVGPLSPQLVPSTTWNLWSLPLCETFDCLCDVSWGLRLQGILVASAISDLLPQWVASALCLVASATWYLRTFRYGILVASATGLGSPLLWDPDRLRYGTRVISAMGPLDSLYYMGLLLLQLIASATWDLCRLS